MMQADDGFLETMYVSTSSIHVVQGSPSRDERRHGEHGTNPRELSLDTIGVHGERIPY